MISVQTQIELESDLNIANMSRKLDEINLSKQILQASLTKLQDKLIQELCQPTYQRQPNKQFQRAETTNRTLKTRHDNIELKLAIVHNLENNSYFRPLLLYLGVSSRQRIVDDLDLEYAETATYLTYRDSKTVLENLTHTTVSKNRIHTCVQKVGNFMNQERRSIRRKRKPSDNPTTTTTVVAAAVAAEKEEEVVVVVREFDLLTGDGTKAHGRDGKKNDINVILGKENATSGEKELLGLDVNKSWAQTALQFEGKAKVAVSDNEPALRKVLLERSDEYQACILHGIWDVKFYLWQAKLPKEQRMDISGRVEKVLWTLRNSVDKHIVDGDVKRLRWRVDWTLEELKKISSELFASGLDSVGRFICNAANHLVTFARLVIKGVSGVPFSNNLIERLMGEIAKRVKHKWMHWSECGLENLLNILLIRYCNKRIYKEMKEKYLKPNNNNTIITVKIT